MIKEHLYKIEILLLKLLPTILATYYLLQAIFAIPIITSITLSSIFYVSFLQWLFMLISSFAFKFCIWHRMPLYYIMTNNIFSIFYYCFNIPNVWYIIVNIILFGAFSILGAYLKNKYNVRINKERTSRNNR